MLPLIDRGSPCSSGFSGYRRDLASTKLFHLTQCAPEIRGFHHALAFEPDTEPELLTLSSRSRSCGSRCGRRTGCATSRPTPGPCSGGAPLRCHPALLAGGPRCRTVCLPVGARCRFCLGRGRLSATLPRDSLTLHDSIKRGFSNPESLANLRCGNACVGVQAGNLALLFRTQSAASRPVRTGFTCLRAVGALDRRLVHFFHRLHDAQLHSPLFTFPQW
jgi:hypothetical protein